MRTNIVQHGLHQIGACLNADLDQFQALWSQQRSEAQFRETQAKERLEQARLAVQAVKVDLRAELEQHWAMVDRVLASLVSEMAVSNNFLRSIVRMFIADGRRNRWMEQLSPTLDTLREACMKTRAKAEERLVEENLHQPSIAGTRTDLPMAIRNPPKGFSDEEVIAHCDQSRQSYRAYVAGQCDQIESMTLAAIEELAKCVGDLEGVIREGDLKQKQHRERASQLKQCVQRLNTSLNLIKPVLNRQLLAYEEVAEGRSLAAIRQRLSNWRTRSAIATLHQSPPINRL